MDYSQHLNLQSGRVWQTPPMWHICLGLKSNGIQQIMWGSVKHCTITINLANTWPSHIFEKSQKIEKNWEKIISGVREKWVWHVMAKLIEMVLYFPDVLFKGLLSGLSVNLKIPCLEDILFFFFVANWSLDLYEIHHLFLDSGFISLFDTKGVSGAKFVLWL